MFVSLGFDTVHDSFYMA